QDMRGSGPWALTNYQRSSGWQYQRNPNWYGAADRPFLDGIDYAYFRAGDGAGPVQSAASLVAGPECGFCSRHKAREPGRDARSSLALEQRHLRRLHAHAVEAREL